MHCDFISAQIVQKKLVDGLCCGCLLFHIYILCHAIVLLKVQFYPVGKIKINAHRKPQHRYEYVKLIIFLFCAYLFFFIINPCFCIDK